MSSRTNDLDERYFWKRLRKIVHIVWLLVDVGTVSLGLVQETLNGLAASRREAVNRHSTCVNISGTWVWRRQIDRWRMRDVVRWTLDRVKRVSTCAKTQLWVPSFAINAPSFYLIFTTSQTIVELDHRTLPHVARHGSTPWDQERGGHSSTVAGWHV